MKTFDLLQKIELTNLISEPDILLLKRRINQGEVINLDYVWNNEIRLTSEQDKKGIDFLNNLYQTGTGKVRINNPFGYREIEVLSTFDHFEFKGFFNAGNKYYSKYLPIYVCCGGAGSFEYYYNDKVNIIG